MTNNETMALLITEKYPLGIEISKLESINLAVAAIAGWTEIELWNTYKPEDKSPKPLRVYQGTNEAHPELGKFIPKYTESLDTIALVYLHLQQFWKISVAWNGRTSASCFEGVGVNVGIQVADTPALALCKLLLAINPAPIAPPIISNIRIYDNPLSEDEVNTEMAQVAIIDDDGEVETVFEAEFV
jgi:hypothetical protein